MRIGIVGNNLYGQIYTRSAEASGRAEVVAICPEFTESLEPFATEHRLRKYSDLASMLQADRLDAVLLASVTAHHESDAVACLRAGVHVLVDRPMAMTVESCDRMLAVAKSAQRILMIGYVLQFWPEYVAVREMLQRGDLGRLVAVTVSRVSGVLSPSWQARLLNPDYGFGGLEAHAHDIDLLISWLGEPQAIIAQGTFTDHGGCARVHTLLKFPGGYQAGVEADYRVPLNFPLSMYLRIVGEEGTVIFTFRGALAARESARRHLTLFKNGQPPVEVQVPVTDAYVGMLNHFFDCVDQTKQPQWGNAEQGRQSVQTLLSILQSAKTHQRS